MTDLNQIVIEVYFSKVRLMQLGDASDEEYIELAKKLVKELEKVDRINSYKGMSKFDERLDEILDDLGHDATNGMSRVEAKSKAKQAIRKLMLEEVIGENQPEYSLDNPNWGINRNNNRLRTEQRKIVNGESDE